jgi:hypothetical protein
VDDGVVGGEPEDGLEVFGDDPGAGEAIDMPASLGEQNALAFGGQQLGGPEPRT